MTVALREQYPLRLILGSEDATHLLADGATFSNVDPGGFETASFSVPKDMPNTLRGQYVRLDCGLKVAWEGRVSQIQRSLGAQTQINCEGYGALLKDQAASMVFVDRDLTHFTSDSVGQQVAMLTAGFGLGSFTVAADSVNGAPALALAINDAWGSTAWPLTEAWYDAGPENKLAKIWWKESDNVSIGSGGWQGTLQVGDTDASFASQQNMTFLGSGYWTPPATHRYATVFFTNGIRPGGIAGDTFIMTVQAALYGDHGLTGRGPDPVGFYPSDIATWTIRQAPGIQAGVIVPTDASNYIIDHSAYYTPVNLDQIINDMAVAQGWHWGVWESLSALTGSPAPRCDFRPRAQPGAWTAFCLRRDCDTLDVREDLSQQYNRAIVNFTDVAGVAQAAIVTRDNPVLDEAGIPQRTIVFSGGTMTSATAGVFGLEALAITNVQARVAGSADIIGPIGNPSAPMPPWLLKAGIDRLRVGDLPATNAWGSMSDLPISRVECSLSVDGINTSVEFGSGANLVETLQARLAAATVLVGQGGVG